MENMNTWRLSLYIDNSREIYSITESLSNSLAKKIKKGVELSVETLAKCSMMKRIVSMAAKMVKEYDGVTVSTKERKEAALKHAEYIMDCAEEKINWFNLKAGKEIRVQTLIQAGFNLEADFFSLSSSKTGILCECMKADGYKYDSPLGRSRLRSYWYSLQRVYSKMNNN